MQNDLLQLFPSQKLEIENHKLCATVKTNYGASCNRTSAPRQPWRQSPHVIWNNGSPYLPSSRCPAPPLPCPQSVQSHLYPASTSRASYPQQNYWSFYFAKMLLLGFRFNWILRLVRNQLHIYLEINSFRNVSTKIHSFVRCASALVTIGMLSEWRCRANITENVHSTIICYVDVRW